MKFNGGWFPFVGFKSDVLDISHFKKLLSDYLAEENDKYIIEEIKKVRDSIPEGCDSVFVRAFVVEWLDKIFLVRNREYVFIKYEEETDAG